MADVFISYSSQNADYVRRLAHFLRAEGFDVWFDDHIETGSSWSDTIFAALDACAAFIVVMTPAALDSTWVERECLYAEKRGKARFPLLLEGEEFPFLIDVQYTDVREGQMPPAAYVELLREAVTAVRPASVVAPPKPAPRQTLRTVSLVGAVTLLAVILIGLALLSARPPVLSATPGPSAVLTLPPFTRIPPQPIEPGAPAQGRIGDEAPEEWFQFEARQGVTITVLLEALSGDLDPYLELYGPGYTFLDYNDELNDDFDDASLAAGLTLTAAQTGTHYIRAMRFPAVEGDFAATAGEFRLTLQVEPAG